eukprot:gnl/TRDRNA2_/TRDRNA2_174272_c1_seq1.p1 gnl/TRDRNA2_/TRDRNA2_174272_c1~~gnl/TRDRNA2_/TRDRNA2_174272_c1_seq1.p1  ORF type:complete len:111 (-),score=2.41 gnl/TRDRNA2_/TRDRNA2_174272_c1_seq1:5-337(-)
MLAAFLFCEVAYLRECVAAARNVVHSITDTSLRSQGATFVLEGPMGRRCAGATGRVGPCRDFAGTAALVSDVARFQIGMLVVLVPSEVSLIIAYMGAAGYAAREVATVVR